MRNETSSSGVDVAKQMSTNNDQLTTDVRIFLICRTIITDIFAELAGGDRIPYYEGGRAANGKTSITDDVYAEICDVISRVGDVEGPLSIVRRPTLCMFSKPLSSQ